jgi:Ca-activated chloride channel family protein
VSERRRSSLLFAAAIVAACTRLAAASPAGAGAVGQGNALYGQGQYDRAVSLYDQALTENPRLDQARFNKADAFFRMDDLAKAMDLYSEVSAQTKEMDLVKKAKYNLGNAHFQRGLKQRDSDLQKALEDLRTSITYWRAVLDMDPSNENAKKNKEVAGLIIKDILDELKKKQGQDPNQNSEPRTQNSEQEKQGRDPNQAKDPNQNPESRGQRPEEKKQGQDPNKNSEPRTQNSEQTKQGQDPNQAKDPNQQPAANNPQPQKVQASDATAQEILDREQQQKKDREKRVRVQRVPVDKDW